MSTRACWPRRPADGANGDAINALFLAAAGAGPSGVVLIHHMPGWDEWYFEAAPQVCRAWLRRSPRPIHAGHIHADIRYAMRATGEVPDERAVGDNVQPCAICWPTSAARWASSAPVRGRAPAPISPPAVRSFDAVADLWGGGVVWPDRPDNRPGAHRLHGRLAYPLSASSGEGTAVHARRVAAKRCSSNKANGT